MGYKKFGSQLPDGIYEHFTQLEHGDKRIVCAAAILWYFNADAEVARLYREWARAIAEGLATIEEPPESVQASLKKRGLSIPRRGKKGKCKGKK